MGKNRNIKQQLDRTMDYSRAATQNLPMDGPHVGQANRPLKTFEEQTPRDSWNEMQGVVGPGSRSPNTVAPKGEQDGNPSIDSYNKAPSIVDDKGVARHPHWRNDAVMRQMHEDIATRGAAHEGVNPESNVGSNERSGV
jgi:hypothetical protein